MRPILAFATILIAPLSAAAQGTCWRPSAPATCRDYVVTDVGFSYWLTPTSTRFDGNRSRVVLTGSAGYLRAVGARDALGATLDAAYYNRRSVYAGIEWLYPTVAAHAMARWDHWVSDDLALRLGAGTPVAGARHLGNITAPGLNLELGARWRGRLGVTVRMERHRLDDQVFAFPALPGLDYPLGNVGTLSHNVSTVRTDWYVGLSSHGWTGLTGFAGVTLLALFSAFTFSS